MLAAETFPTTGPEETIARATRFFTANGPIDAMGSGFRSRRFTVPAPYRDLADDPPWSDAMMICLTTP